MNTRQLIKYRVEWAKAWKALRGLGRPAADQDKERKRWHLLIGAVYLRGQEKGTPKSSKHLNNAEFDRFLKRCAAAHSPASLTAQLDLDDQPLIRLREATDALFDLLKMHEDKREAYLAGIYANVQRKRPSQGLRVFELHEMPDEDLQLVVAALTHTAAHKLNFDHYHNRRGKEPLMTGHEEKVDATADDPEAARGSDPAYVPPQGLDVPF